MTYSVHKAHVAIVDKTSGLNKDRGVAGLVLVKDICNTVKLGSVDSGSLVCFDWFLGSGSIGDNCG
jgi:hypothetical protein